MTVINTALNDEARVPFQESSWVLVELREKNL